MHPTGAYYWNTLFSVLTQQRKITTEYHLLNRLDKLTSGAVLMSDCMQTTRKITKLFKEHKIEKIYYARVSPFFFTNQSISLISNLNQLKIKNFGPSLIGN